MSDVPRDPEFYHPSVHAVQQQKYRDIPWEKVAETLETGDVTGARKENCRLFIREFPEDTEPVAVVANVENGHILTVEWRKDDYEPGV